MKIQLVSFGFSLTSSEKRRAFLDIFNQSNADFILFAGHTLDKIRDLDRIADKLDNLKATAFIEIMNFGVRDITNCIFKIARNKIINCHSHQIFTDSAEINRSYFYAEQLIHELSTNRSFTIKDKNIRLLVCGEINILKNIQSEDNRVEFRTKDKTLEKKFNTILQSTDIIINPLHSPMGYQGKLLKRREFLSSNNKAYFSTANMDKEGDLETRKLQYGFVNGKEIEGKIVQSTSKFIVREFQI